MNRFMNVAVIALYCALMLTTGGELLATVPYTTAGGPFPGFGKDVIDPFLVGGKEYSHDRDSTTIGAGVVPPPPFDAQQVIAWDGIGGATDASDFTGTRPLYTPEDEIDAIANHMDFAYQQLKDDIAHLVFSVDDYFTVYGGGGPTPGFFAPSAGPIPLGNGNLIGGAGEYSVEESTFYGNTPDTQYVWAPQPRINAMPFPVDVDGVEVWGPEPPLADTDKYSLDVDGLSGGVAGGAVSVWNGSGSPYVLHSAVVAGVTSLLGPLPPGVFSPDAEIGFVDGIQAINVDALMVQDIIGDPDRFDVGPDGPAGGPGPGDEIIFSIRQIVDPGDADGYYATGSEIFILNADGTVSFLVHGGHTWDHAYALSTFFFSPDDGLQGVLDINALEAIGEFATPEPSSVVLLLAGGMIMFRRRRQ